MRRAAAAVLCGLSLMSCGYHVSGHADTIPKTIRTVAIPAFSNATTRFRLSDQLPEAISREFTTRTRYQVVNDPNEADAVLRGAITNYNMFPTVFDPATSRASVVQVIVTMNVTLTERATGKVIYSRPSFEMKQNYEISSDQVAFFDESDVANQRISRDVARMVVSAILENF